VRTTADDKAILSAYETIARRLHPDRFQQASAAVQAIADQASRLAAKAHEAVSTSERRVEYADMIKRGIQENKDREKGRRVLAAEAAFQTGETALRARDYESALVSFGKAMEEYPEEGEYHAHYGWALHLCKPDSSMIAHEAIEHVKRGIKLAREREKPYLFLGRLYKVIGRNGAAEKMFVRAVQMRPNCVDALRELRLINMRRDKGKGLIGRILRR
jgi:curved DNA-binding protein CbpA